MATARYDIDPSRSSVTIDARSSVHPIHSETHGLEGWLELELLPGGRVNLALAPAARLSFRVEQLKSGNPLEDRELRRRIDARRFPTIDGELTEMTEGTEGSEAGIYRVKGDITFRGVTRSYEDDMRFTENDDGTISVGGRSTFDVRDFGMEPPKILVLRVYPEVSVTVAVVATLRRPEPGAGGEGSGT